MDDYTSGLRPRQIAQFPHVATGARSADLLLLQRYGLGGPYISLTVAELLATGLTDAPGAGIGMTYGSQVGWARDWPDGQPGAGPAYHLTAGSPGRPGFDFDAPVWIDGDVTARGNIIGAGVYSGGFAVATVNYVTESTVASFNDRTGHVWLTPADILKGGGVTAFDARMQGTCLAPTQWNPAQNDDTIATTAFVQKAMCAFLDNWISLQNPVLAFNGRGGNVELNLADVSLANQSVPGQYPLSPTPPLGDNSLAIATTAFVAAAVAAGGGGGGTAGVASFNTRTGAVTLTAPDITAAGGALIASPAFTGAPSAPTAASGTNTTQLATTAFVAAATSGAAPLASPAFTGVPTAPTPSAGDNSTALATTAFVAAAIGTGSAFLPLTGGTVSGPVTFTDVTSVTGSANIGAVTGALFYGYRSAAIPFPSSSLRWVIRMPNGSTESGANVGSDFSVTSYNDTGAQIEIPLTINRATGSVQIKGSNTNDTPPAGWLGELLQASTTTGVSMTTGVAVTIATIALTGGDWDVFGCVVFTPAATTTISALTAGINSNTNQLPTLANMQGGFASMNQLQATFTTGVQQVLTTGMIRWRVSVAASPQNYFLVAQAGFATSTMTATGYIGARRRR